MSPHVEKVTQLCLKFMTFDPNYNYDDEEEEEEDSMDVEDGLEEGLCVPDVRCSSAVLNLQLLGLMCSSLSLSRHY